MEIFYPKGFALIRPKKALKERRWGIDVLMVGVGLSFRPFSLEDILWFLKRD
jgi:hypothetical protein